MILRRTTGGHDVVLNPFQVVSIQPRGDIDGAVVVTMVDGTDFHVNGDLTELSREVSSYLVPTYYVTR